jgi:arabinan endo-1,5-alpha-L-arabinosidase
MLTKDQIQMRDPYVLRNELEGCYYLYGTTDPNPWRGKAIGFDVYRSVDLVQWEGPFPAFRPDADFWSDTNYWAPEVHEYKGKYYLFATFKADGHCRGTQILIADHPLGPFQPHSEGPVTPRDWECLDGTLWVDESHVPWMVFCHEWVQIQNGTVCAIQLSPELDRAVGEPNLLFSAQDAKWVEAVKDGAGYVTDGPFAYTCADGALLLLWSSFRSGKYAQGIARSESGSIMGPWVQQSDPIYESDGGHGMIFKSFEGAIMLALHTPNQSPEERPIFLELQEVEGQLKLSSSD